MKYFAETVSFFEKNFSLIANFSELAKALIELRSFFSPFNRLINCCFLSIWKRYDTTFMRSADYLMI